jgi:ketosteroid isomerase-like protein
MNATKSTLLVFTFLCSATAAYPQGSPIQSPEDSVRQAVEQFEKGLNERDLKQIEGVVAEDLVAFENGHRNSSWSDFRDHHLIPEMKEPAPPSKTELVSIKASDHMAWAYTKTDMKLTRKSGEHVEGRLWSIYVLEKRQGAWKIVLLDWSFFVPRPAGN